MKQLALEMSVCTQNINFYFNESLLRNILDLVPLNHARMSTVKEKPEVNMH